MELQCDWNPRYVLQSAAEGGHLHVLEWAIKNGASLELSNPEETASMHAYMLSRARNFRVIHWLLETRPASIRELRIEDIFPPYCYETICDTPTVQLLVTHFGLSKVVNILKSKVINGGAYIAPSVIDWFIQQGARFDANVFYHLLCKATQYSPVQHVQEYLRYVTFEGVGHLFFSLKLFCCQGSVVYGVQSTFI